LRSLRKLWILVAFLVVSGGKTFARESVGVPKGVVEKKVSAEINRLYREVKTLKRLGFRQYYYYESYRRELESPLPEKKPDYEKLQESYLRRYLKMTGR